jgi:hypothetical protein
LSSQTSSNGIGNPWYDACSAALIAPAAVEWFAEASPKLAIVMASAGHGDGTPSFAARAIEKAVMQQGWIRRAERRGDGGIALVPGRADRVEAMPLGLQPPGGQIGVPAAQLRVVQALEVRLGQVARRRGERVDALGEQFVDLHHDQRPQSKPSPPGSAATNRSTLLRPARLVAMRGRVRRNC